MPARICQWCNYLKETVGKSRVCQECLDEVYKKRVEKARKDFKKSAEENKEKAPASA